MREYVSPTAPPSSMRSSEAPPPDGFDDWCKVRDEHEDHSVSAQYVAPGVIGSEDLDEYGTWREEAPYGEVWVPSGVAAGWAPYTYGHWVWISPWGWTWVDDEPWGFAPFHYGRWVYDDGFWGWAPGPYYARPFYAPALVAWFGGPRFGVGFGFGFGGGIGWCPLGWGEPFFPWYRGSWGYFSRVNIYNTRITNINRFSGYYHGGGVRGRIVPVCEPARAGRRHRGPAGTLTNSLSVRGTAVRVPATEFGSVVAWRPGADFAQSNQPVGAERQPSQRGVAIALVLAAGGWIVEWRHVRRREALAGRYLLPAISYLDHRRPVWDRNRSAMTAHNYVPRPPAGARIGAGGPASQPRSSPEMRSTPRAPSGGSARPSERSTPRSSPESSHSRTSSFAPQSSSPTRTAPSNYGSNAYSGRSSSPWILDGVPWLRGSVFEVLWVLRRVSAIQLIARVPEFCAVVPCRFGAQLFCAVVSGLVRVAQLGEFALLGRGRAFWTPIDQLANSKTPSPGDGVLL